MNVPVLVWFPGLIPPWPWHAGTPSDKLIRLGVIASCVTLRYLDMPILSLFLYSASREFLSNLDRIGRLLQSQNISCVAADFPAGLVLFSTRTLPLSRLDSIPATNKRRNSGPCRPAVFDSFKVVSAGSTA